MAGDTAGDLLLVALAALSIRRGWRALRRIQRRLR